MLHKFLLSVFSATLLIAMVAAQNTAPDQGSTSTQNDAAPQQAALAQTTPSQSNAPQETTTPPQAEAPQQTEPSQPAAPPQNTAPSQQTQPPQNASPDTGSQLATPPANPPDTNQTPQDQTAPSQSQPPNDNSATPPAEPPASSSATTTDANAVTDPSAIINQNQGNKWLGKPVTLTNVTVQDTTEAGNFWVGTDDAHRILVVKPESNENLHAIQVQKGEAVTISGTVRSADDFMASMTGADKTVMNNAKTGSGLFVLADKVITPANEH